MKKTTGYSINFAENTITLTKAFAQRAKNPSTNEFRELAKLHKNLPDFTITMRTAVITVEKETYSLLRFQYFSKTPNYHSIARQVLEQAVKQETGVVIALTATPASIRSQFHAPSVEVPIDQTELKQYEVRQVIGYTNLYCQD